MKEITEEDIEQYVRFPESLSKKKYAQIKQAIADSPELKQLCKWFASYYEEVDRLSGTPDLQIPLFYYGPAKRESRAVVLAAMSPETKSTNELQTLATFASEKEQMIVRFLQESGTGRCQLHLIRNNKPADHELSMICMPEHEVNLLVDATRHLDFEPFEGFDVINWLDVQLSMRLPAGYVSLDPTNLHEQNLAKHTEHLCADILIKNDEAILKVELYPNDNAEKQSVLVCEKNGQKTQYRSRENDTIEIPVQKTDSVIQLWFFA